LSFTAVSPLNMDFVSIPRETGNRSRMLILPGETCRKIVSECRAVFSLFLLANEALYQLSYTPEWAFILSVEQHFSTVGMLTSG
jgi:hypothetical protein